MGEPTTATKQTQHAARLAESFLARILVDCPRCGGLAVVTESAPGPSNLFPPRRMVCTACAKVLDQPALAVSNPAMGLVPRLQLATRHGVLVLFNEAHLAYVRSYLAQGLRKEVHEEGGIRNRSVISRLPAWAKAAKNRSEIVAGLDRLASERL